MAHGIVLELAADVQRKGHIMNMGNFFTFVGLLDESVPTVSWKNGAVYEDIMTSPMHLKYITHMHGVNMADQLWAPYNTQNCIHKWWHMIFIFFLLDMTVINMFINNLIKYKRMSKQPISHL